MNFKSLPKVELHHHFDGAFRSDSLYKEAQRRNLPQADLDYETFASRVQVDSECRSLTEFLATFELFYDIAQNAAFLKQAGKDLVDDFVNDKVIYAETRFAPHLFASHESDVAEVVDSVLTGIELGKKEQENSCEVFLIICLMRGAPVFQAKELLELYERFHSRGVVGIDLAGDESQFRGLEYASVFTEAHSANIPITIHAGEAAGSESVWSALKDLKASRIGHGIRSLEDPALIAHLQKKQIPLEVCLTSNVQTGTVPSFAEHPFLQLYKQGIKVTINTDDPAISGIDLSSEWQKAVEVFQLDNQDVKTLTLNAIDAAFANEKVKSNCRKQITDFFK